MPIELSPLRRLLQLLSEHPMAAVPALGAGIGGATGAIFSDEGASGRGALQGALQGALLGTGGALTGRALHSVMPTPEHAMLAGSTAGGLLGGLFGQRRLSPWGMRRLELDRAEADKREAARAFADELAKTKEAAMAEQTPIQQIRDSLTKQAAAHDNTPERLAAFDFGVDVYCQKTGLSKAELAKKAGVAEDKLSEGLVAWLNQQTEEALQASKNV